jgi:hypothetical protein
MGFMDTYFLGARLFYWIYLLITLIGFGLIIGWTQRHRIKRKWYEIRNPELLFVASIIYPGNMIRDFPILKPKDKSFSLQSGTYLFSEKAILKNSNTKTEDNLKVTIDGQDYNIDLSKKLKYRWEKFPRLYYKAGCPYPIIWGTEANLKDKAGNEISYSAAELEAFGNNTIIKQIYAELQGAGIIIFVLIIGVVSLLVSLGILSKLMGWIK